MNIKIMLLIFIAGISVDICVAFYTRCVSRKLVYKATLFSGLITLVNYCFLTIILTQNNLQQIPNIIVYVLGNMVGTYIGMVLKI
jgi:uncharacterized protein YebE (UPF0316 family)